MEHTYVYPVVWATLFRPERLEGGGGEEHLYTVTKKIINIHSEVSAQRRDMEAARCEL
jgi:hypothetical protein